MSEPGTSIVVIGDPARTHGRFSGYPAAGTVAAKRFDAATDTWTVATGDGRTLTGRIVVNTVPAGDGIVAVHGVPNYFRIPGPHTARQARYVASLVDGMHRCGSTRIEARSRVRVRRRLPTRGLSRFYLSGATGTSGPDEEVYDGPATVVHDGREHPTRVRLTGHFDPIDGQYHWQGMIYAELPGTRVTGSQVSIRVGEHTAAARITEQTPWGTLAVVGAVGYPPFPLADVEISVPPRA